MKNKEVKLIFDKSLVNAALDRFGYDIRLIPEAEGERFSVREKVNTEHPEPFFGWLFRFGKKVEIVSPVELREMYAAMLEDVTGFNKC